MKEKITFKTCFPSGRNQEMFPLWQELFHHTLSQGSDLHVVLSNAVGPGTMIICYRAGAECSLNLI